MVESPHYKDLLQFFNDCQVEYLVVGGYAVMKYSEPRYTKDLDIWVKRSPQNSIRIFEALAQFGAPLEHDGITRETFSQTNVIYQIGIAPVRVDILTHLSGVDFEKAWQRRAAASFFGVAANFISLDDLIANKRAAGRASDLEDLKKMEKGGQ
jgi:predicted nucleotidyltransferase